MTRPTAQNPPARPCRGRQSRPLPVAQPRRRRPASTARASACPFTATATWPGLPQMRLPRTPHGLHPTHPGRHTATEAVSLLRQTSNGY